MKIRPSDRAPVPCKTAGCANLIVPAYGREFCEPCVKANKRYSKRENKRREATRRKCSTFGCTNSVTGQVRLCPDCRKLHKIESDRLYHGTGEKAEVMKPVQRARSHMSAKEAERLDAEQRRLDREIYAKLATKSGAISSPVKVFSKEEIAAMAHLYTPAQGKTTAKAGDDWHIQF
jgi:hypothetical protein